ncbi:MAG: hypothetical protein V2A54_11740 [Bacteroidota bacterium]
MILKVTTHKKLEGMRSKNCKHVYSKVAEVLITRLYKFYSIIIVLLILFLLGCTKSSVKCTFVPATGELKVDSPYYFKRIVFNYENDSNNDVRVNVFFKEHLRLNDINIFNIDSSYIEKQNRALDPGESAYVVPQRKSFKYMLMFVYAVNQNDSPFTIYGAKNSSVYGGSSKNEISLEEVL